MRAVEPLQTAQDTPKRIFFQFNDNFGEFQNYCLHWKKETMSRYERFCLYIIWIFEKIILA